MIFLAQDEWPELGDLVVATVKRIESYGAYVALDEYGNKEGLLHISEISTRWVRNIRNHVREGQKIVLLVHRLNSEQGQIDLSLKRVGKGQQREKMEEFKKETRARSLIAQAAKVLEMGENDLYEKAGASLVEKYGNLYDGLEEVAKKGPEPLVRLGLPEQMSGVLAKVAKDKMKIKMFRAQGILEASTMDPKGVIILKEALGAINKLGKKKRVDVNIYTIGAPRYRIEITTDDPKKLDAVVQEIVGEAISSIEKAGGTASFKKE